MSISFFDTFTTKTKENEEKSFAEKNNLYAYV